MCVPHLRLGWNCGMERFCALNVPSEFRAFLSSLIRLRSIYNTDTWRCILFSSLSYAQIFSMLNSTIKSMNRRHSFSRIFPAIYLFLVIQFYSCDALCLFIVVTLSHVLKRVIISLLHLIILRFRTRIRTESNNCNIVND